MPSIDGRTFQRVDISDVVILAIGIATVGAMAIQVFLQMRDADRMVDLVARQTAAAERQVEAARQQPEAAHQQVRVAEAQAAMLEAPGRQEPEARLIAVFGGGSPNGRQSGSRTAAAIRRRKSERGTGMSQAQPLPRQRHIRS